MYNINDTVIYRGSGICKIEDIRTERFGKASGEYYVLTPVYERISSRYFVPVGSESGKFFKLLEKSELDGLFDKAKKSEKVWVDDEKKRQEIFSDIIKSADRPKIISMIGEICEKQKEKRADGKKLRAFDEQLLKEAQSLIENEIAYVASIDPSEVRPYILKRLNIKI
ncbi:MAG: CarD family transcriptional regulator [Acutalibacteraceae bacterium]